MKLAVYGNCQVGGLGASLRALLPDSTVDVFHPAIPKVAKPTEYDLFFVQKPSAKRFSDAPAEWIRLLPSIVFTGFHPDCAYLVLDKKTVGSPVGDYSSTLIVSCFLAEIPPDEVPRWFTHSVFSKIGYLAEFDRAKRFLLADALSLGFDLSAVFDDWMSRREAFMYTINHPAIHVLYDICRVALEKEGIGVLDERRLPPDRLARAVWWPVYDIVAERLGVAERPLFKYTEQAAKHEGREALSFAEFVAGSYRILKDLPRAELAQVPAVARVLKAMDQTRGDPIVPDDSFCRFASKVSS